MNRNLRYILASQSPRRRELMGKLGIDFEVEISDVIEVTPPGMTNAEAPGYLSYLKAGDVFSKHPGEAVAVIGSDTVVLLNGSRLEKPRDKADAVSMLKQLSGSTHEVATGVTVFYRTKEGAKEEHFSFTSFTEVEFYKLSEQEILSYVDSGEPMDKAGAYGIQGLGMLLVKRISGDYPTVIGLPVAELNRRLRERKLI